MNGLIKQIKSGEFSRVYLLYGEESFLKLRWRDRLTKALIPSDDTMNLSVYQGKSTDWQTVIDQAETLPFFADRRVIRLDNTGLFSKAAGPLADYLQNIPEYAYFIFTEDEVDKRSRMYKTVSKAGYCAEFKEQSRGDLEKWVLQLLGNAGVRIRREDMSKLLDKTGSDMFHISTEVDKLIGYCGERGFVTSEDIDTVISGRAEERIFEMISAMTAGRTSDAMSFYADLLALNEPPIRILSLISNEYLRLRAVKELDGKGRGAEEISRGTGVPVFAVRKMLPLARSYSADALNEAVSMCADMDGSIKTGRIADKAAVDILMARLTTKARN